MPRAQLCKAKDGISCFPERVEAAEIENQPRLATPRRGLHREMVGELQQARQRGAEQHVLEEHGVQPGSRQQRGFQEERGDETGERDEKPAQPDDVRNAPGSPQQVEKITAGQGARISWVK
jgi:hypothetical protein